jgi:hypothetical protein
MSRLQMRKWTILLAAVILLATRNSPAVVAQEDNDPFGAGKPAPASAADDAAMELAIRKALTMPTNMEFIETPLQEAVDYFKDFHHIEIQLDSKSLEAAGLGSDIPVTRTLKRISLESALRLLLSNHDLTFVVDQGVLLITTPAAAADMIEIRVYDVEDLLAQGGVKELSEILRLALDPRSVQRTSGLAAARATTTRTERAPEPYPSVPAVPDAPGTPRGSVILPFGNLIVVRASILEHEALAELLQSMRTAMHAAK